MKRLGGFAWLTLLYCLLAAPGSHAQDGPEAPLRRALANLITELWGEEGVVEGKNDETPKRPAGKKLIDDITSVGELLYGKAGWYSMSSRPDHQLIEQLYIAVYGEQQGRRLLSNVLNAR